MMGTPNPLRDRAVVAILTVLSFVVSPVAPLLAAQAAPKEPPKAATPAPAPTPAAAPAPQPVDGGWPRAYSTAQRGRILVYQPQVASWEKQKQMVAYAAVAWETKGATKPALGTLKIEADTKVSASERLVNFSDFKIAESNFPTVPRDQVREIVAEIDKTIPQDDRVIALDRVLASIDRSQITPKNVEGVKADPPTIFYSQKPAILVNLDGDPDLEPDQGERPQVRGQHQLGPLRARADEDVLRPQRRRVAEGVRREGAVDARGHAAGELREAPRGGELEGSEGGAARQEAQRGQGAAGVREHDSRGDDPGRRAPRLHEGGGHGARVGQQHGERPVPDGGEGDGVLPGGGAVVLLARLHRPLDVRDPEHARGLPEDIPRAPALARARVGAGDAAGRGRRAARPGAPDRAGQQEDAQGPGGRVPGGAQVPAHRDDAGPECGEHGQGRLQGRRRLLHVLPGRVVQGDDADRRLGSRLVRSQGDLPDPPELALPQRHVRDGRGGRRRRVGHVRDRRPPTRG